MWHRSSEIRTEALLISVVLAMIGTASATNETVNFGANLGVLNYVMTSSTGRCTSNYGEVTYTEYDFSDFSYVSAQGVTQPIDGDTYWYYNIGGRNATGSCPSSQGPTITYNGSGYTINLAPRYNGVGVLAAQIEVPGYINPKYKIVGLLYAPPGNKSSVDYTTTNLVSSTVTTKSSYKSGYTQTTSVMTSDMINPWKNGSIDTSSKVSSTYTQSVTTTDSTAVTVQKTTSTSTVVPGPACAYCGVDHDYDIIEVWLNPVELYTLTNDGAVQANGYGFSTYDQPGMDVYQVYAGELNGDIPMRSSTVSAFARSWASVFVYPSGGGSGLTAQDEQNILKADPYWNCTYRSAVSDATDCAEPPSSTRYTETSNVNFPYEQPEAGGQPTTKNYSWSYTNTDTEGQDVTYSFTQSFGLEQTFSAKAFGFGFQTSVSDTFTTTETYETSSQFTGTNTTTAAASITGPPCNVVSGVCSPMYPPANAYDPINCTALTLATAFGQGDSMYIYQDNLFGTFLLEPYGQ